jgi:hypothetical protein
MTRKWYTSFALGCSIFLIANAFASEQLHACYTASPPFDQLTQLVLAPTVENPPRVQLCHRTGNAAKHFQHTRTDKAIEELRKFINEVKHSSPKHLSNEYSVVLIAEAERLINYLSQGEAVLGEVSGGVFSFASNTPSPNATVTLRFVGSTELRHTTADANGLFSFDGLPPSGLFIVSAQDSMGAIGSATESLLDTQPKVSVLVLVDQQGNGQIGGQITQNGMVAPDVLITAIFPETKRQYTTTSDASGAYQFTGLKTDGTVILIASDNASGGSASFSTFLTPTSTTSTVNLSLNVPSVVQPELTNGAFSSDLQGWTTQGTVQVIERSQAFSSPN